MAGLKNCMATKFPALGGGGISKTSSDRKHLWRGIEGISSSTLA